MALTSEGGSDIIMPVQPMNSFPMGGYGGFGGGFGYGGDWIILFLFAAMFGGFGGGWGGMNGWGGGFGNMFEFPWLLNGQNGINNNLNDGFRSAQISDGITSIRDGISGLSTQLCGCCGDLQMALANGFAGTAAAVTGAQNAIAQQLYGNELASLERSFAAQTANTQGMNALQAQLAQCCCDNRAATQDVKYTIATEACATRANSTANTQAILDKLCQLELDGYKRENDQLRSQLQFANLQASQVAQTAEIRANNATVANQLVSELRSCPIPAQPVYGNTPIFSCGGTTGCGCAA